ncbi:glycosylphosphatidylinositol-alpha 1,2 mannosyltransferase [Saccharomyces eubayanus]|uniref:glycosylphosphatidylinositol-alpha 1,2 mannosyltransferase n=1 Tax=Saccharomyces eubayanus TaxID=1080349 RepID=UPI0006C12EFA|nr:SMP3-like protein [Saccharomyces eubayanus]KOG96646.1 SMP3-like protein [Saccharomyces eubayanus]
MKYRWWLYSIYAVGLLLGLGPSYIHPDEHFQCIEILVMWFTNSKGTVPWEFDPSFAARSYVPLLLVYGPLFTILKFFPYFQNNPISILYLMRLQNYLMIILCGNFIVPKLIRGDTKAVQSLKKFLFLTSYVTWTYQIHTFSNSVETIILMNTLIVMESIANAKNAEKNSYKKSVLLGFMISLGVFNRVTFPAFLLLPCLILFWKFYRTHWRSIAMLSLSFLISSCLIVLIDTKIFSNGKGFIITPWNNLKYNINIKNLQLHGLHSRYTHLLVNLPQMLGPALLLAILSGYKLNQLSTYSIISGMLFLSLFQHQELRFLIPLVPLFITNLSWTRSSSKLVDNMWFKGAWLLFNIIMGFIMGISHQSGIVQFLGDYSRFHSESMGVHIWWKTYSPPTWMYMDNSLTVSSVVNLQNGAESIDEIPFNVSNHHVIDLKGCDLQLLKDTIKRLLSKGIQNPLTLVTSDSMISKLKKLEADEGITLIPKRHYLSHLDLDHFDFNDLTSFKSGLTAYSIE